MFCFDIQRIQDQEKQLSSLQQELSEAVATINTLTDQLEGAGQEDRGQMSEVRVQSLEREVDTELERRQIVSTPAILITTQRPLLATFNVV